MWRRLASQAHAQKAIIPAQQILEAHCKLSDYYYQFGASPFYTWVACKWGFMIETIYFLINDV